MREDLAFGLVGLALIELAFPDRLSPPTDRSLGCWGESPKGTEQLDARS
jgi:hypothetical protein